tara:strand:- start:244 stop:480 length:237 start_codon:yes stop_codon:yes gene_type:complete
VELVIKVDLVVEKHQVVVMVQEEMLEVFLTMTIRLDTVVVFGITLVHLVVIHMELVAVVQEVQDTIQHVDMQELVDMV